jgi:hypothetical protein
VETDVDVGLFGASGVEETHMNMQDSKFNGLPFNRMERRAVIIVRPLGSLPFALSVV